ncbi:MAG: hypothetical protein HKN91_02050 [Acidimicrobiia bacterium]|nr:hypothetical protein [Acidimicrobiia bacterium]
MPQDMPDQPNFPILRKGGVDPTAVESHLVEVQRFFEKKVAAAQARYGNLEAELEEARKREEAVHLTLVAATKTKEELLTNAKRDADAMISNSKGQSESLLTEAKKEAFRLVSEARETTEGAATAAREEAKQIKAEAEEAAEATRNAARREAIEMIDTVESDTAALMAAQEATINDMRRKYEEEEAELAARVEVLRATAADLEARLKAIATGSLGQATTLVADAPDQPAATAPVTAPEPPTVAPKARRPVRNDLMDAPEPAQAEPSVHKDVAAAEVPAAVAEPVQIPAEFTETVVEEVAEVAPVAAHVVEDHEHIEEVSSVVEPAAEIAEIEQVTPPVDDIVDDVPTVEASEEEVDDEEVVVEEEPVPAAVGAPAAHSYEDGDARSDGGRKGSYYSRRSAKLPRIGTEAGRSALAAANAIRGATRGEPIDPQDVTAQTA